MPRVIQSLTTLVALFPASRAKNALLRALDHDVNATASIGPCLILRVQKLVLGPGATIGAFNVIRDVNLLSIEENSTLGHWNWVSAAPSISPENGARLMIGKESAITSRHYLDVSGGIFVGDYSTLAGVRTTIITHGISWKLSRQQTRAVIVGNYAIVGSTCALVPGAVVPDATVIGMGSTVAPGLDSSGILAFAPRATTQRSGLRGRYFERTRGYVE
jgi:carbonic anhydrase/acetyltransferase-like protein (isoleucine patch superfamily)